MKKVMLCNTKLLATLHAFESENRPAGWPLGNVGHIKGGANLGSSKVPASHEQALYTIESPCRPTLVAPTPEKRYYLSELRRHFIPQSAQHLIHLILRHMLHEEVRQVQFFLHTAQAREQTGRQHKTARAYVAVQLRARRYSARGGGEWAPPDWKPRG